MTRLNSTGADREAEPPGLPVPVTAADVLRLAFQEGERRLRRFAVDLDTGRVLLQFAEPGSAAGLHADATDSIPDPAEEPLTDREAAVAEVVRGMAAGAILSSAEIARKAGYADSGTLRKFIRGLAAAGLLRRVSTGFQRVGQG